MHVPGTASLAPRGRVHPPRAARVPLRALVAAAAAAVLAAGRLAAQPAPATLRAEVTAGGEAERYLRLLQVVGAAPLYPWSIRGFSPAEVDRLLAAGGQGPWAARLGAADSAHGVRLVVLRPSTSLVYNSAFPAGSNDGAVWAGRGVTAAATAGALLRWGALSVRLEPVVFWAQNREFALMPTGTADTLPFNDPDNPRSIDLPQRFGDGGYARLDPGQSTARIDAGPLALGFSTANEQWGPTADLPLILGTNAPGFPHAFLGTAHPVKVGIGTLHGRIEWGSLSQSAYSAASPDSSRRFMAGVLAVFTPRGLDGLEVGGSRFFHSVWPKGGFGRAQLLEPLQGFFKSGLEVTGEGPDDRSSSDNQLVSVFARWVLPRAGFESWAEYAREDHSWDLKDAILQPDHTSGYTLGARKVWQREGSLLSLRGELLETQPSNLQQVRNQGRFYRHAQSRQGHTQLGQVLGSPAAYGGAGSVIAFDAYTPRGRWTLDWTRTRIRSLRLTPQAVSGTAGVDVVDALGGQAVLFHGGVDAMVGLHGLYELNRNGGGDAFNLSANLGLRIGF
jgi:hypothetical protein